jgi:hypothetical protein
MTLVHVHAATGILEDVPPVAFALVRPGEVDANAALAARLHINFTLVQISADAVVCVAESSVALTGVGPGTVGALTVAAGNFGAELFALVDVHAGIVVNLLHSEPGVATTEAGETDPVNADLIAVAVVDQAVVAVAASLAVVLGVIVIVNFVQMY